MCLSTRHDCAAVLCPRRPIDLKIGGHTQEMAEALHSLPLHHKDPFDRLLVAQALVEHVTLVTHDRALAPYGVPTLWI